MGKRVGDEVCKSEMISEVWMVGCGCERGYLLVIY